MCSLKQHNIWIWYVFWFVLQLWQLDFVISGEFFELKNVSFKICVRQSATCKMSAHTWNNISSVCQHLGSTLYFIIQTRSANLMGTSFRHQIPDTRHCAPCTKDRLPNVNLRKTNNHATTFTQPPDKIYTIIKMTPILVSYVLLFVKIYFIWGSPA